MINVLGFVIVVGACIAFPPLGFVVLFMIGLAMMGDQNEGIRTIRW